MLAALDALRELDLLRGGEQVDLADVLQEELQRVGADLARLGGRLLALGLFRVRVDDLDLKLLEGAVKLVDLRSVELQLGEREGDFLGGERAGLASGLQERLRLVRLEDLSDACRPDPLPLLAHYAFLPGLVMSRPLWRMRH